MKLLSNLPLSELMVIEKFTRSGSEGILQKLEESSINPRVIRGRMLCVC